MLGSLHMGLAGTASAFVPTDIAGCKLWLRGDRGVTQSGGTVSAWADQSGNGNDAIQPTGAKQPAFSASSINGLPGLTFNGSSTYLQNTVANLVASGSARTVFIVAKGSSTAGGAFLAFRTSTQHYTVLALSSGLMYCYTDGVTTNASYASPPTINGTAHVFAHNSPAAGGNIAIEVDGTPSTVTSPGVTSDTGTTGFLIGTQPAAGIRVWAGDMDEVAVYDTSLSPTNQAAVTAYLRSRYGL